MADDNNMRDSIDAVGQKIIALFISLCIPE